MPSALAQVDCARYRSSALIHPAVRASNHRLSSTQNIFALARKRAEAMREILHELSRTKVNRCLKIVLR